MTGTQDYGAYSSPRPTISAQSSNKLAADCAGKNFFEIDRGLQDLLGLYLPGAAGEHFRPHFERLGELAGGRLNELAMVADRNPPVLHARNRWGQDEDWIEYHPAYREMEQIAFGDYQFHAMSHRGGVLGWPEPLPPVAKYAFQYLFVQAEFGQMCPISVTDTSIHLVRRFGSPELQASLLPRMLSGDLATLWTGTQFMTEKSGGSDVGAIETEARRDGDGWRLWGEKWFCSHTDADVALLLARPAGAPAGTKGLALFAMPRHLEDGSRNRYRIVRLKEKLGTRSMASGEIKLEGAHAFLVGELDQGLKQMLEQVNLSRLSHAVRAAAMMRRCVNESLVAARARTAFGRQVVEFPLQRRQLLKLITPAEQALSMMFLAADTMGRANACVPEAEDLLRILTPLAKLRACRDNIRVATGAMEVRGGNGYIEDFVNARLVRDAHVGVLWEGTSNINAQDVIQRAVGKEGAHHALATALRKRLDEVAPVAERHTQRLARTLDRALAFAEEVARDPEAEDEARKAAGALYNVSSAVLLAWEGIRPGVDARRLLHSRFVLEHRLAAEDPVAPGSGKWQRAATDLALDGGEVPFAAAVELVES
ncbi:MAG: acyl-CoA dehydrogenase family protein [Tepidiformaceae bacterium]